MSADQPPRLLCDGAADAAPSATSHPLRLPAEDVSVPRARHAVDHWLRLRGVSREIRDRAALVLTELTANAVTHTDSRWIVCGAALTPQGTVQVEVHDDAAAGRTPHRRRPSPSTEGGRGLHIVEALAEDWGVTDSPVTRGNAVWARLLP